jgi:hypothetical protein
MIPLSNPSPYSRQQARCSAMKASRSRARARLGASSGRVMTRSVDESRVTPPPISAMPCPNSDRQAWEQELNDLPAMIDSTQRELDATRIEARERHEALRWRIRRPEIRMADLQARLTTDATDRDGRVKT